MRREKPPIVVLNYDLTAAIVVLAVRTYAIWNRDRRVGIGLALLLGLCQVPHAIVLKRFIQTFECEYCIDSSFFLR